VELPLDETLRRLERRITEGKLDRRKILNPGELAAKTSLPLATVQALLRGKGVPEEPFKVQVTGRIATFLTMYMNRDEKSKRTETQLVAELHQNLGLSKEWVRQIVRGQKVPSSEALHELAVYFKLDGQETYFTSAPATALNRELTRILHRYEAPERDPIDALMERWGVKSTDMRLHGGGGKNKEEIARLLEAVFKTVLPQEDQ
jgi:transcriptional regulator with XRE-family HTH domain